MKRADTDVFSPDSNTDVHHYSGISNHISVAEIKISGRHPISGFFKNEICNSVIYCLEGEGKISINGEELILKKGDCVSIVQNSEYHFEGELTILYMSTPPFYAEQNVLKK